VRPQGVRLRACVGTGFIADVPRLLVRRVIREQEMATKNTKSHKKAEKAKRNSLPTFHLRLFFFFFCVFLCFLWPLPSPLAAAGVAVLIGIDELIGVQQHEAKPFEGLSPGV